MKKKKKNGRDHHDDHDIEAALTEFFTAPTETWAPRFDLDELLRKAMTAAGVTPPQPRRPAPDRPGLRMVSTGADTSTAVITELAAPVAARIEEDIARTGWRIGHVLGTETELLRRYQVSPAILREAMLIVERRQIATGRPKPAGGLVIREPHASTPVKVAMTYLKFAGATLQHLLLARTILEPLVAARAAERATDTEANRLRTALLAEQVLHGRRNWRTPEHHIHMTLAELAENPALRLFVDVLSRSTHRYTCRPAGYLPDSIRPILTGTHSHHHAIIESVAAGDSPDAENHMLFHLKELRDTLRRAGDNRSPLWPVPPPGESQNAELVEFTAIRMFDDILRNNQGSSYTIGAEADLLNRYKVAPTILRGAVRLLEDRAILSRHSPHGPLVVSRPDPGPAVDVLAAHLNYKGLTLEHIHDIRDTIELACLDHIARHATQPDLARRLHATLSRLASPDGSNERFHVELVELADNPVLTLFQRTLLTLQAKRYPSEADTQLHATSESAHLGVLTALLDGHSALARHRLRQHLQRQHTADHTSTANPRLCREPRRRCHTTATPASATDTSPITST